MSWSWLRWWRPPFLLRQVTVHLQDTTGTVLFGDCWQARGPYLVLRNATVKLSGLEPQRADGDVVVHRANVSYLQVE